jgi:hypothetical protein
MAGHGAGGFREGGRLVCVPGRRGGGPAAGARAELGSQPLRGGGAQQLVERRVGRCGERRDDDRCGRP